MPGPVEFATGRPVNPPIMPGWDDFPIPEWFASRYSAPVLVDNDVNIMALGEHWMHWRETEHLLLIKVGTGIGCGIVADGHIHRGAQGAAGDIGHIRVPDQRRRHLPLRQRRLPRGGRRRPGARTAARRGGRSTRPHSAATWSGSCGAATPARSGWCARPAARSARCSPARSTSSTPRFDEVRKPVGLVRDDG